MALPKELREQIPHYSYRFNWDDEDKIHVVSVDELPGCMTHGSTMEEALKMAYEAVEGHIETLYKAGLIVPTPVSTTKFKGDFLIRATPELQKKLAQRAQASGAKSFNRHVVEVLEQYVKNGTSSPAERSSAEAEVKRHINRASAKVIRPKNEAVATAKRLAKETPQIMNVKAGAVVKTTKKKA